MEKTISEKEVCCFVDFSYDVTMRSCGKVRAYESGLLCGDCIVTPVHTVTLGGRSVKIERYHVGGPPKGSSLELRKLYFSMSAEK